VAAALRGVHCRWCATHQPLASEASKPPQEKPQFISDEARQVFDRIRSYEEEQEELRAWQNRRQRGGSELRDFVL
jgi:hypothetical protein